MPDIRFHLDENVDPEIAQALRNQGIDVTTTQEVQLLSENDSTQFEYVKREGRVIITHDRDFLRIAAKESDHPGIIFCSFNKYSLGKIILHCVSLYHHFSAEEIKCRIEFL